MLHFCYEYFICMRSELIACPDTVPLRPCFSSGYRQREGTLDRVLQPPKNHND